MMFITDVLTRIRRKTRRCPKAKAGALPNVPVGCGNLIREITQYFFIICIIKTVIIFVIYWRYIRHKWYKKIKNYYNLKGSNTLILQTKKAKR